MAADRSSKAAQADRVQCMGWGMPLRHRGWLATQSLSATRQAFQELTCACDLSQLEDVRDQPGALCLVRHQHRAPGGAGGQLTGEEVH